MNTTGKQFSTTDLIRERQKAILNVFGASFAILGQGSTGSYSLADTQKGLHAFFVEKDINFICEVFNKDLIPQLLALNEIRLEDEDMPKLVSGIVDEPDKDLISKAAQRMASTAMLPNHPDLINENMKNLGYDYRIPEDVVNDPDQWLVYTERYLSQFTSRAGDGMSTPGDGTSNNSTSDTTTSNMAN